MLCVHLLPARVLARMHDLRPHAHGDMRVSVRSVQLARQLVPAYVVHPRVETVEADVQGYHWTGCRLVEGIPEVVRERESQVDLSLFRKEVERSIVVSREFETPNQEDGRPPRTYPSSLVHHILRSVFSRAPSYPQLRDLHLAQGLHVSGSWECCGEVVAVSGRPGDMLLSRHPVPPLFSQEEVESARSVAPPTRDLFSDLEQWGIRNWTEEATEDEGERGTETTFPHLHTLWIVDSAHQSEVQLLQRGLLFTFSRLVQQAVWQYGPSVMGDVLPAPLSGQCIVTNGQRLALLWLQLGSLQGSRGEERESTSQNVVAVERPGLLYSGTEMVRGRKRRRVVGLQENVLRTLLATLLMH